MTRQSLEEYMRTAPKVWVVPVRAGGKTVIVEISKALELHEIDTTILTPDELKEAGERAGKWQVVASTCYEGDTDYGQQLQDTFALNRSDENRECILFGGVPGIQTVLAVLLDGDEATGIISMQRDIVVESNSKERSAGETITIKQNDIYSVESFAESAETLRFAADGVEVPDNTTGVGTNKVQPDTIICYTLIAVGTAILIVGFWRWKRSKADK